MLVQFPASVLAGIVEQQANVAKAKHNVLDFDIHSMLRKAFSALHDAIHSQCIP
jgi:hypothetical protein